jgi:3-isopropylmalate/(R)-2-methylmalate dehydratase small subunit
MPEPFHSLTAVALVLLRDNIDTDAIIPSREIRSVTKVGLAAGLFANWRYLKPEERAPDPTFVLNDPAYHGAQILIAGENFGCGSSREQAVWALHEYGVRAVLASSFNAIFYRNCLRNGILPGLLVRGALEQIAQWVRQDPQRNRIEIDLSRRIVLAADREWSFQLEQDARDGLLEGLDEIEQTLRLSDQITAFRNADMVLRPWVYGLDLP